QEFKVESGFYTADLGNESGAQIISAIRPGSNQFHGTLFEFLRNDVLDAKNFFESPTLPKQPLRRNNFGGVLSGRIIPDKLFFTANFEGFIQRSFTQAFATYPSALMKQGILTEPYFKANGIIDPTTGLPFPGNVIPSNRISPQAEKLLQFF